MKRSGFVCLGVLVFLVSMVHGAQIVPVAVSPGSERGAALVGQTCPTFSWTSVDWATGYKVAVFPAFGVQIPSYEEMAAGAVPVIEQGDRGRASSWTPSSEEQLNLGEPVRLVCPGCGCVRAGSVVPGKAVHGGCRGSGGAF